ncbi:MAG: membrane protein insertase YidC [Phycisphaera sp.]|nr:membrane protein insertase YidC [Phycisphaera sp.]
MSPIIKKFLVTAVLAALIVGFGIVVATGPGPAEQQAASQAITEASRPKLPSADGSAAGSNASPAAAEAQATPSEAQPSASGGGAPASAPTPAAQADAAAAQAPVGLVARVPAGMTAATGLSSVGSLDPAVAPVRIQFAASGAGISEIVFADFWNTADDRRAARDARRSGDAAQMPADSARFVLATSTRIGEFTVPVLAARELSINGAAVNIFGAVWGEDSPGRFATEIADANGRAIARVERSFVRGARSPYEIQLAQRVVNLTDEPMRVRLLQYGPGDMPRDAGLPIDMRRFHFGYLFPEKRDPTQSFVTAAGQMLDRTAVSKQIANQSYLLWPNESSAADNLSLSWFGTTDRYFTFAVHAPFSPPGSPSRRLESVVEVKALTNGVSGAGEQLLTTLWTPVTEVAARGTASFDLGVYAGPLDPRVLDRTEPYAGLNMGGLILYTMGGCCAWCTFSWLANFLLWFLSFIHDYLVFDWGLAIIGLVVVVRLILHPVQKKSQIAMQRFSRAMTAMKPELDALQKKFKDDPRRMQQEQLRLFREKGVSPAGCLGGMLPIIAQMPIWMALYAVLFFAFDLRQQPAFFGVFQNFGGWAFLADLSAQDNFLRFPNPINLFLFNLSAINLLPILMGIVFYFQQKYMSPPITPNMTEEQIQQQKIMKWMMVIMFPIMTYIAPSGLTLYILTSTCIGIVESRIIKKQVDAMDLSAPPAKPAKKGFLARVYEQALERAAEQQKNGGRSAKPRGKGR